MASAGLPRRNFVDRYHVSEKIAEDLFGNIYRCFEKSTANEYTLKIKMERAITRRHILNEINICKRLDHSNVAKLIDVHTDLIGSFLVFDMVYGGQLLDDIMQRDHYTEFDACLYMDQILNGVHYLHMNDIIHRDLNFNSILITNKKAGAVVKITDFGAAASFKYYECFRFIGQRCSYYTAPEMLEGLLCREKVDTWACGVLLYIMLVGFPPFSECDKWLLDHMEGRTYTFPKVGESNSLSKNSKRLINGLLDPEPPTRLTAMEALSHPFITDRATATSQYHRQRTIEEMNKHKAKIQDKWDTLLSAVKYMSSFGTMNTGMS